MDTSTMLGAPPNRWKKNEQQQMRLIHQCYKSALVDPREDDADENAEGLLQLTQSDAFAGLLGGDLAHAASVIMGGGGSGGGNGGGGGANGGANGGASGAAAAGMDEQDGDEDGDGLSAGLAVSRMQMGRDSEPFLPSDSPLRSKNGEGKEPKTVPFRDFAHFEATLEFDFWKDNFRHQNQDRILSEVAQSTVAHICSAQSRGELRVRHGSVPLGRILRKKREQLTPLALCLHEFKTWATHQLRTMSVFERDTYRTLERRIRYLELLQRKEVWGGPAMPLQSGMRPIAHDKLFRLFLSAREDLTRARDYAKRGYCRRASREKLGRLGNLLKDVVLNEMRVASGLFSMGEKLSNPRTRALQPTDLLNSWKNQAFVNYENLANVCLRALCEVPLVRAALLSNYDGDDVHGALLDMRGWNRHNLFCLPARPDAAPESPASTSPAPVVLLDEDKSAAEMLPEVYAPTAARIKDKLREADPHQRPPLTRKAHVKLLRAAFKDDGVAREVMSRFLVYLAALQDLVPALYISFELWELAGQGGDYVLFDMLREQCIAVMQSSIARVRAVQTAQRSLVRYYGGIVSGHEDAMERRRLRTKKAKYQPAWVANYYSLKQDLLIVSRKAYTQAYVQLWELARDAWEYDLTAEQLSDKIDILRQACEDFAPELRDQGVGTGAYSGRFQTGRLVEPPATGAPDWLGLRPQSPPGGMARESAGKRGITVPGSGKRLSSVIAAMASDVDDEEGADERLLRAVADEDDSSEEMLAAA